MATYVLVHGGWVGGWIWRNLSSVLRAAGHEVHTPTLTGLGDRAHLARPEIDLETHIEDVLSMLRCEDLWNVVLVGHSAGGMVIAGVADRAAERIAHVVYLDAFVPESGETLGDLLGADLTTQFRALAQQAGDGWRLPLPFPVAALGLTDPAVIDSVLARVTPQPFGTVTSPLRLTGGATTLPHTYVYFSRQAMGLFETSAARARARHWSYIDLDEVHGAVAVAPQSVANVLLPLAAADLAEVRR
jgi:pimeloyl-ACP methyl ester carboxylesterase